MVQLARFLIDYKKCQCTTYKLKTLRYISSALLIDIEKYFKSSWRNFFPFFFKEKVWYLHKNELKYISYNSYAWHEFSKYFILFPFPKSKIYFCISMLTLLYYILRKTFENLNFHKCSAQGVQLPKSEDEIREFFFSYCYLKYENLYKTSEKWSNNFFPLIWLRACYFKI